VGVVKVVGCRADLFDLVRTLHSPCRFARRLNRRQQKSNENADNGNDDKKLNKSKGTGKR
jgi:hypothetical protein